MSHIAVMDTELLWFLYILVVLFPVRPVRCHKDSLGLHCTNDLVNNVSCTWISFQDSSGEDCWISGVMKDWKPITQFEFIKRRCKLKQHMKSPPGCSFAFEGIEFSGYEVMPNISVECNGKLVENLTDYTPKDHIKMHPPDAPNVSLTTNETRISWSLGSPVSYLFKSTFDFEVQVTKNKHSWGEAMKFTAQEQELKFSSVQLKGHQRVRVRVKPSKRDKSHWSNWSPVTSWMGPTDKVDETKNQEWWLEQKPLIVMGVMLTVCLIITVPLSLYKNCKTRRFFKVKPIPNPSYYFHSLHSVHGGNLEKWLNPLPLSESFITPQSCDQISSVEVCEDWKGLPFLSPSSSPTSALLNGDPSSGSNISGVVYNSSSLSDYSNMGYFMSSSSGGSPQTDPAYFTYQDDFCNLPNSHSHHPSPCAPLASCPSYESLKRVPECPDSGFGITMENEMDITKYTDTEGENVLDNLISPVLILPAHLPSHTCPPSAHPAPPHPSTVTQTLSDSQQATVPEAAASGSSAAWLVSSAMCRSSSMPVEPSKTGYLTLKELHTTFSNKSI
ncbi:interleukin-2 receptor subunit beta [Melanotaenia boesemani]|uniref:interleukin-2 receptor subunit beta n=1 Tax=Melanotaenia boesemani TaxID=1250792 RepID=UPI001C03C6AE|nr:interleukin-2 receptor subunit beta [Melanotaenia boesemani]